jgi:hypothetical protein
VSGRAEIRRRKGTQKPIKLPSPIRSNVRGRRSSAEAGNDRDDTAHNRNVRRTTPRDTGRQADQASRKNHRVEAVVEQQTKPEMSKNSTDARKAESQ